MPSWDVVSPPQEAPVRRVREEVRDGVVVAIFSVLASSTVTLALMALTRLAG